MGLRAGKERRGECDCAVIGGCKFRDREDMEEEKARKVIGLAPDYLSRLPAGASPPSSSQARPWQDEDTQYLRYSRYTHAYMYTVSSLMQFAHGWFKPILLS